MENYSNWIASWNSILNHESLLKVEVANEENSGPKTTRSMLISEQENENIT